MTDDRLPAPLEAPKVSKTSLPAHVASPADRIAHREWIAGAIKTLVVICNGDWPSDGRLEAEMGFMWANDLEGFTQPVIETAIAEWRRTEQRKPTPAGIRRLCVKHTPRPPAPVYELKNLSAPTDEEKARVRALTGQAFPELKRFPKETHGPRDPIHSGLE